MKKIILTLMLSISALLAGEVIISSGEPSKSYSKMADVIIKKINKPEFKNLNSKGSLENIDNLISGKANVGLAFADSYMYKKNSDPRAEKLKIVGTIGKGCMYVVAKKGGKIDDDGDLETAGVTVDPGRVGSGANSTWGYLGQLDEDFKKPTVKNIGGDMGLNAVLSGQTDAMLQMQAPSTENALVKDVLANKDLTFIPMTDGNFTDKLPNGQQVYTREKILLSNKGFFDKTLETICTENLVLANDNVSDEDLDLLAGIILRNKNEILGNK